MKRTVIIGGGVAGLSLAIALRKKGSDVVVCERESHDHSNGHAFLLHPEAMRIWQAIVQEDPYDLMPGKRIEELYLKNSNNELLQHVSLDGWVCMKRCEAMRALAEHLPDGVIKYGCRFSHFLIHDDRVVAAVFKNGEVVYGDCFIGADGAKSAVRNALFGPTHYTPVLVKEILGSIRNKVLYDRHPNHFTKYLSNDKGLAIGFIPCNEDELIWFMQFDVALCHTNLNSQEEIATFCRTMLSSFPEEVQEIMECKSVVANYLWNATDFDLLPTFHQRNVLLIGDAAHVALPFTSAGVTNALLDVDCLLSIWNTSSDLDAMYRTFYDLRSRKVRGHIETGRNIRSTFLKGAANEVCLPLIQDLSVLAD